MANRPDYTLNTVFDNLTYAQGTLSSAHNHDVMDRYTALFVFANAAPAPGAFTVVAATDVVTKVAHGYKTGLKVQLSSSTSLPVGLLAVTDYFIVVLDADTFKLSSSLANALIGTVIDITSTGVGTHTVTPVAIAGFECHLQYSIDGTNYYNLPGSTMGAVGTLLQNYSGVSYNYLRSDFTLTAGQVTGTVKIRSAGAV